MSSGKAEMLWENVDTSGVEDWLDPMKWAFWLTSQDLKPR